MNQIPQFPLDTVNVRASDVGLESCDADGGGEGMSGGVGVPAGLTGRSATGGFGRSIFSHCKQQGNEGEGENEGKRGGS